MDCKHTVESFQEELEKIRDRENPVGSLQNEISCCQNFVPKFFMERDLKEDAKDGIRYMYNAIDDPIVADRCIKDVDIRNAYSVYRNYLDGMVKFITELINYNEPPEEFLNLYKTRLNTAKGEDSAFINGIFSGSKFNELREMKLKEATANIEFLVDFFDSVGEISAICKKIKDEVGDGNELLNSSLSMLACSVSKFCESVIIGVIQTYEKIMEVINAPKEVVVKKPVYKLL